MYIVPFVWLYIAVMMAVAEATSPIGTLLGAVFTFLLYGLLPVGLMLYFMGSPARRRANRQAAQEQPPAAGEPPASDQGDSGGHAPADPVAPVGEKTPRL